MKGEWEGCGRQVWESLLGAGPTPGRSKTGLEAGLRAEVVVRTALVEVSAKLGLWGGVIHSEDRAIRSLGVSPPSGWSWMESQESEVGVSGRGLCDL